MKNIRSISNEELLITRTKIMKQLEAYEKEAIDINNHKYPGGVVIDRDMVKDYNDLVNDLIDVLIETIKRDEWIYSLKRENK